VVIPLSDKDAKDLQRWNNEQEDQRRINTRGSKATRRSAVPGLRDLNKLMRERPFGAGSGQSSASTEKPLMVSRQKDRFGKYQNVPVGLPEGQRNLINSIKFDKFGDAVVNGRYAPELTNTLKSMIKGTLQVPGSGLPTGAIFTEPPQALDTGRRSNLPTGVIGYDASGRPIMSKSMAPRSTTPFIADGVRVTDSLLKTYITQLEKNSGVTGTTPFSSRQLGPELYERLFGSETKSTQLSDIEKSRARLKQLQDLKKSVGGGRLSRAEAAELSRLQETIRKATTVDPALTDMPEESASKIKVSNPEEFQKMRKRFKELDTIMKTKGLAGAELAEYEKLEQSIRSVRTEATQRPDITSDKPGKVVSEKTKPETKVSIKNIGDTKAPGIYTDGKYNSQVTYNVIQAMVKAKESAKFQQVLTRQGGIRVGKVFVSVDDMQQLARSIPADTEVVYNKQGNPTVKPRTTGGGMFGITNKTLGTLGIIGAIGDIARLAKEWSSENRKVPIS
jgi:hypothetical protein